MTDAGFFKGTSAEQDARFADKKKKLMKTMKFGDNLSQKVDMSRVSIDCIRPWVIKRITELLNFEDEVVCNYVLNQLDERYPDPKEIQINITGFLNSKNARIFLTELWDLLLSAMENSDGVPTALLEAKKAEILKRQDDENRINSELRRKEEELRQRFPQNNYSRSSGVPAPVNQTVVSSNNNGNATGENPSTADKNTNSKVSSRRSRSPSSPRQRGRHDSSKKEEHSVRRGPREDSSRHRRRRRHSSSRSSSPGSRERIRESRRHYRSRSRSSTERVPPKPVAPETDWRKDLMAGRRRSPPEMPENSYYGHHKDYKRSRGHHDHLDRRGGRSPRHMSPMESDRHRPRDRPRIREHSDEDKQHRRHRPRYRGESRSPSHSKPELEERSAADRANKYHNRRAQWAQEDDELIPKVEAAQEKHKKRRPSDELVPTHKRDRLVKPEGPSLPPREKGHSLSKREDVKQETSSSSSESGSEGSSSSDDEGSGSSTSSSSSTESVPDTPLKPSPEGPALPPALVTPEGPSLPPSMAESPKRATETKSDSSSGSSGSSSASEDSDASSSSSESTSASDDANDRRVKQYPRKNSPVIKRSVRAEKPSKRAHSPEGPSLPPTRNESHRTHSSSRDEHRHKPHEKRGKHDSPVESAEEALRRRALASLIRAAGDKRRTAKSPS